MNNHVAVVAIGGNALIKDPLHISAADQYAAVHETAQHVAKLIISGWRVVIGHCRASRMVAWISPVMNHWPSTSRTKNWSIISKPAAGRSA